MSTSDRVVVAEAAGAAVLVVAFTALASPDDVWLRGAGLHPIWLPIIVLSARYATRGLFAVLAASVGSLLAASFLLGDSVQGFATRTRSTSDLLALSTAILVAWIAMLHESRIARADARLAESTEAYKEAEQNVHALHASLGYLRARHDRLDVAIGLWRNLAARMERGDAGEASRAVLELCEIRAGARAGVVQLRDGNKLSTLACRGQWSAATARPHDIDIDATVRAAIVSRNVTPASAGASETDCDVAVPVTDEASGVVIGVIALRGVSPGYMRAAELRDLGVLAQWLAPALARQVHSRSVGRKTGELGL
jgi:hypothetical protein